MDTFCADGSVYNLHGDTGCYEPPGRCPGDPKTFGSVTPEELLPYGWIYRLDQISCDAEDGVAILASWGCTSKELCKRVFKKGLKCVKDKQTKLFYCSYGAAGGPNTESGIKHGATTVTQPGATWPTLQRLGLINVQADGENTKGQTPDTIRGLQKGLEICHDRVVSLKLCLWFFLFFSFFFFLFWFQLTF